MTMFDVDVLFVILDCWNVNVGFDIYNLWEVQTICGRLVFKNDKKLSLQFMKKPYTTLI